MRDVWGKLWDQGGWPFAIGTALGIASTWAWTHARPDGDIAFWSVMAALLCCAAASEIFKSTLPVIGATFLLFYDPLSDLTSVLLRSRRLDSLPTDPRLYLLWLLALLVWWPGMRGVSLGYRRDHPPPPKPAPDH